MFCTYKDFLTLIVFDEDDKIWVGRVLSIEDSINFHGYTIDEAETMFHQAVDNYIEFCKELNKTLEV